MRGRGGGFFLFSRLLVDVTTCAVRGVGGTVGGERLRCGRVDAYDIISLYVPREADSDAGLAIVRSSQFSVLHACASVMWVKWGMKVKGWG